MTNITLAMDEKLVKRARAFAKSEGTTLNALVRSLVSKAIDERQRREESRQRLLEMMDASTARLPKDYKFDREELYENQGFSGHNRVDLRGGGKRKQSS